jgi:[protein-PII] uridylyltransferase
MDAVAIALGLLQDSQVEVDLKALGRSYLDRGRRVLCERHRQGAGGMEVAAAYSTVMDHLIRYLFSSLSAEILPRFRGQGAGLALVAQGGYGRGELNPYSDIDLLFLHNGKVHPFFAALNERVLHTLWDLGLEVGYATRSISDCIRLAESDMKIRTALLDARFLCGDFQLFGEFNKNIESKLLKKGIGRFVREKINGSTARHKAYGGSVYLLEPEVKEGLGGLRDIQTARWIARAKLKAKDLDSLVNHGIIDLADLAALKESQDFLMRVRNEMHFVAGKHQDQLTFEQQEKVSEALGFASEGTLRGVEVFMRAYYLHAMQISRLAELIVHRVTDCDKPRFTDSLMFGRALREGVRISKGHITVTKPEIIKNDPANLIRIFDDAQKYRCRVSHETRELLRGQISSIDDQFRRSAAANQPFFSILKWKDSVYETLVEMHRAGVLGAFIPEFNHLLCMVLHDAYHTYTVDEHSLMLIQEIERLRAGKYVSSLPLLTQIARETDKIELLYLGMMFHDIGKGFGGGHSEIGANLVRTIARRMKLNADDEALVEFLVRHHLLMTNTAFRRDLEDDRTIFEFAKTMSSVNNLKMLYLLTFADVKAVGPDVWNPWKASLLGELYVKTLNLLEEAEKGEFQREDIRAVLRRIQGRVRRQLLELPQPEAKVDEFIDRMPDRYFLSTPEADIPKHFALMDKFRGKGALSYVEHFPERNCSSVVICTNDRPGLFASITGVLTSLSLNILNARIFTASDGRIIDVFRISHSGRPELVMAEAKWAKFKTILDSVLEGTTDVVRLVDAAKPSLYLLKRAPKVSTVINIDNEASDDFSIVEVFTDDRMGVLFNITHSLHLLGLSIHVAKISTNVDQVADVFYVTDSSGNKIADPERVEEVRSYLFQSLAPHDVTDERRAEPVH